MSAAPTESWAEAASGEDSVEAVDTSIEINSSACTSRKVLVETTGMCMIKTVMVLRTSTFGTHTTGTESWICERELVLAPVEPVESRVETCMNFQHKNQ